MGTVHVHLRSLVGAGLIASTLTMVAPARAQDCVWIRHQAVGPASTYGGAVAYHAGLGRIVYVDYVGNASRLRTWAWDGTGWTLLNSMGPGERFWYKMAYDSARNRLVLFGGFSSGFVYRGDTWEWDGSVWTQAATTGPEPRRGHAMAYDPGRGRTVLFGGTGPTWGPFFAETWEWNGNEWSRAASAGPPGRYGPAMAFDPGRARTVMYGGEGITTYSDLWEWDGAAWTQRPSAGPGFLDPAWLMHDPGRNLLILIGGVGNSATEAWELDNPAGNWVMRARGEPASFPTAFDPLRGRAVLVGDGGDNWEYHGSGAMTAPLITQQPIGGQFSTGARITLSVAAEGSPPLEYRWRKGAAFLANGGNISGATTAALTIDPASPQDTGSYSVSVGNPCHSVLSTGAPIFVSGGPCYANCDQTTFPPVLNVNDFVCFQSLFASGAGYADCDQSGALNVNDFVCFQQRFAAGCP